MARNDWGTFDYYDDGAAKASLPHLIVDSNVKEPYNLSWSGIYAPGVLQEVVIGGQKWNLTSEWSSLMSAGGLNLYANLAWYFPELPQVGENALKLVGTVEEDLR